MTVAENRVSHRCGEMSAVELPWHFKDWPCIYVGPGLCLRCICIYPYICYIPAFTYSLVLFKCCRFSPKPSQKTPKSSPFQVRYGVSLVGSNLHSYSASVTAVICTISCLLNRLFRRKSNKTPKLHVTYLCEENSPVTGEILTQRASNAEIFPFDDVIMLLWFSLITAQHSKWMTRLRKESQDTLSLKFQMLQSLMTHIFCGLFWNLGHHWYW